ncbi:MAG: ATP-binding cassette domain-containing protein [Halanaerobiales bacterium]
MENNLLLRARKICKHYGKEKVLDIEGIELKEGEVVGLLGPNGSGKTTLIKVLSWLEQAAKREIYFRGRRVREENSLEYRRRLGFIWQHPFLYNRSVAENVALGLKFRGLLDKEIEKKVRAVLERVGIYHLRDKNAKMLSGGEQQKVSIARTLVTDPDIIFIDEPNSSLDVESIGLIEEIISEEVERGAGIMLVTHNFYQARELADRIVFLERGSRITEASPEDFFAEREELLRYL